jgi:hypothetical protein
MACTAKSLLRKDLDNLDVVSGFFRILKKLPGKEVSMYRKSKQAGWRQIITWHESC